MWPTIEALDNNLELGFPLDDETKLQELSRGFREHSGGAMDGCVMAIDGLAIRTRQPFRSEVRHTKNWCYRKGGFALLVLAGADIRGKFLVFTANHSGGTHDSTAWNNCTLADRITKGDLPSKYFIIGDEAFSNTQQLLTPYPGRRTLLITGFHIHVNVLKEHLVCLYSDSVYFGVD